MKTCSQSFVLAILSSFLFTCFSSAALAQDPMGAIGGHSFKVFAAFSGARTGQGSGNLWGGSAGAYFQGSLLGLVLRGTDISASSSGRIYDAVLGPRIALPVPILRPFVEAGGGIGHSGYYNSSGYFGSSWGPAWQVDAGVEHGIFPRLQWRILEVAYGHIYVGPGVSPTVISTGLTLHIW